MQQHTPEFMAAVRAHLLSITAADFASAVFDLNDAVESVEVTITRRANPDGSHSLDVSHSSKSGIPIEGYSL